MMKCSFCGFAIDEQNTQRGCNGCPLKGNCHNLKCPNCGFEMPEEPSWLKKLKVWRKKSNG